MAKKKAVQPSAKSKNLVARMHSKLEGLKLFERIEKRFDKWAAKEKVASVREDLLAVAASAEGAATDLSFLKDKLKLLVDSNYQPPKGASTPKNLPINASVRIKEKYKPSYLEVYEEIALNNLFVDKFVGSKVSVRIGPIVDGKPGFKFLVPKTQVELSAPIATTTTK